MIYLENDLLKVGVLSKGAELCSIIKKQTDKEYIWQANPDIWANHAPILFPIVGGLNNGTYTFEGKEFHLPRHGFVRNNNNVELIKRTENSLNFSLTHSEDTLKIYPFQFKLVIAFQLENNTLTVTHFVSNPGDKPMYFSIGGHPAFNVPHFNNDRYEDHYLEFDKNLDLETNLLTNNGLISSQTRKILQNDRTINLTKDLFNKDALIFRDVKSKYVSLVSKNSGLILSVEYEDFKDLGIWAKPGAPFVCIEPWLGHADFENTTGDIKTKEGIIELIPSQKFSASYTISIA